MPYAVANAIVRTLLAPDCAACGAPLALPLSGPVCSTCWCAVVRLTPPWCRICGDACPPGHAALALCARCEHRLPVFQVARSAALYHGSFREIIHAFKYQGRRALAAPLGRLMRHAARDLLEDVDAIVPVPLHPWRFSRRGFNQADDLASHLGPPVWRVLRRRRHGPPQTGLTAGLRETNVRAAFALSIVRGTRRIQGRVLVLVDDVMTTGATIEACSRVLIQAGARSVRAVTAARAVAGPPARLPP
jgi:ComF family protein